MEIVILGWGDVVMLEREPNLEAWGGCPTLEVHQARGIMEGDGRVDVKGGVQFAGIIRK